MISVAAGMALLGLLLGTWRSGLEAADGLLFDLSGLAMPGGSRPSPGVAVVAIDARSLDAPELVGMPRTLFQPVLGELVQLLAAAGARAIGFDLLLGYSGNRLAPGHDRPLLAALYQHRDKLAVGRSSRTLPVQSVVAALGFEAQSLGLMELTPDGDGIHRRVAAVAAVGAGERSTTLSAALLAKAGVAMPPEVLLLPRRAFDAIPSHALIDVLRCGRTRAETLRQAFAGRIVLVGSVLAEEDRRRTSARFLGATSRAAVSRATCGQGNGVSEGESAGIPGVLVHALAVDAVLRGEVVATAPVAAVSALAAGFGLAGGLLALLAPPLLAIVGVAAAAVGAWAAAVGLLAHQIWFPPAAAMIAVVGAAAVAYPVRFALEMAQRRRVQSAFRHYLAPALVDRISADPSLLRLGGETREVTVMFCDLRGFTAISERLGERPEQLVHLVNRLLAALTQPVLDHGGTVDKYLGDSVMAFWNAPLDDPQHAGNAVMAALHMAQATEALNLQLAVDPELRDIVAGAGLRIGVGINTGRVVVGNMGSSTRFDYTVMGDVVNLASRLQELCKTYGVDIIASEATLRNVPEIAALELDRVAVRGRTREEKIFVVLGDAAVAAETAFRAARAHHQRLIAALRDGDAAEAASAADAARRAWPQLEGIHASLCRGIAKAGSG